MKFIATALLALGFFYAREQEGYEIRVTLKPFKNQYVYLGHYYGKQLPIIDSARLNDRSEAVFKGPKKLGGGIYLIGYPDRAHNFEILIDQNQKFSIIADTAHINQVSFLNSPDNSGFKAYQQFMMVNERAVDSLYRLWSASSNTDSVKITAQIESINRKIKSYRSDIITKQPNSFMATLLKAMKEPEVPVNDPAAKKDSMFAYHYFKNHYWDGVSFYDDRLARTPF